jgi:hypothetical protein
MKKRFTQMLEAAALVLAAASDWADGAWPACGALAWADKVLIY